MPSPYAEFLMKYPVFRYQTATPEAKAEFDALRESLKASLITVEDLKAAGWRAQAQSYRLVQAAEVVAVIPRDNGN